MAMVCELWGCRRICVLPCACDVLVAVAGHKGLYTGLQAMGGA